MLDPQKTFTYEDLEDLTTEELQYINDKKKKKLFVIRKRNGDLVTDILNLQNMISIEDSKVKQ